ncbi:ROK family protein [Lacticaseibacillus camelliae]|uniref:ROK family protein n=1 Tax=Lacticaseibacillus camelliae DSM 22697 = JCM 13995 TaxID=1423730 RepID=A0A0R2F2E8_9LACO|nr:ROK family protein [Lacticaseibacillus camelliae]KRN22687.1 hypothetical protein FC75_GL001735 [Lacticaseibacillus camelliae DSM 22697 = JCM 13995]
MAEISKRDVRENNEKNVLQDVMNSGPTSRSQVAKDLQLNKVTVSDIFSQLIDEGYLEELGAGAGSQAGGRKPTLYRFDPHFGYVISFDLGFHATDMSVSTLDGQVLQSGNFWGEGAALTERLALMLAKIQAYQRQPVTQTRHGLMGVAIGIHGIVYQNRILDSPFLATTDVDIAAYFQQALHVPVVLENEANLAALYARDFTQLATAQQDLVALSIHKGIGAGVVINGQLFRGAQGGAGEVGRTFVEPDAAGEPIKIETLCSEDAVMAQLREALGDPALTEKAVALRYQADDVKVQQVLSQFATYLAMVVHNLVATYDPKIVVINSTLMAQIPRLLAVVASEVQRFGSQVRLTLCQDVDHAVTLGGTALIVHQVLGMGRRQLHFKNA